MSLKGKTLFISGGSRGIGLAIALRAARDGANVTIAAKTDTPHPKLPGTIHTAVEEIEKAGGRGLPVLCDIREETQVAEAVARTVERFGGIDICVNNASAIQLTGTLEVSVKPSYFESGAAARHESQVVQGPCRLHDGEVRHVDVHAGHECGIRPGGDRSQFAVAVDGDRHRGGTQSARWRNGRGDEPFARDHGRCGTCNPDALVARGDRQFLHR